MLRIAAVCGSGLGSSFMLEMNIEKVLKDLGVENKVEVSHYDLGSASPSQADVWIVGKDLESSAQHLGEVRILNSIIDMNELEETVKQILSDKEII